jgi:hypothetical protein
MESGNTGTGVLPAHSADTRMVQLSATAGSGTSFIQSYRYVPYQPSKSQFIAITFVMGAGVADATVDVGFFDAANGIIFRQNGDTNLQFILRTSTSGSVSDANIVNQSAWNIDKLDGTGPSGITLDVTKAQILITDLQFLGMGRVRVGFDIDGIIIYAHEFRNANNLTAPYMQTASLPVQMLLTATATGSTKNAFFKCAAVNSEGGVTDTDSFAFSTVEATETAASGARTHIMSIRPKTTFNGITNRQEFILTALNLLATGANPVYYEVVLGATIAASTWADVNASSGLEYTSVRGAFTNLTNGIVIASGYISGAGTGGGGVPQATLVNIENAISTRLPITLDRAGAVRTMGTISILVTGIGGTSATRCSLEYREVR